MSDNKKSDNNKGDKSDITRIEDLSEYLHEEDDDIAEDDQRSDHQDEKEAMSFSEEQTDPNLRFPPEFNPSFEDPEALEEAETGMTDFTSLEDGEEAAPEEESFEAESFDSDDFNSEGFDSQDFSSEDFDSNDFESGHFESEDFDSQDFDSEGFNSEEPDSQDSSPEPSEIDLPNEEPSADSIEEPLATEEAEAEAEEKEEEKTGPDHEDVKKEPVETTPSSFKAPENFKELQAFAKNISYGNLAAEGNPPFSIILRDVKYEEDVEDIISLLREYKILKTEEEAEQGRKSLSRGMMLIPRLGEYSAIVICHKLRRFDLNILMGLTEEINPPKGYESDDRGLVSKQTIYNSRSHHYQLDQEEISSEQVLASTTAYLEGFDIVEYLGIASENTVIQASLLAQSSSLEEELIERLPDPQKEKQVKRQLARANLNAAASAKVKDFFPFGDPESSEKAPERLPVRLKDIHEDLLKKLKLQAIEQKGNALVGIQLHVSPFSPLQAGEASDPQYQVICSGSVVWVNRR